MTGAKSIADDDTDGIRVPQVDFLKFLKSKQDQHGEIAFLKMDIEGAELDLLEAMDRAGLMSMVRCMVVETHEKKFPDLVPRYEALRKLFSEKYAPTHVNLDWI